MSYPCDERCWTPVTCPRCAAWMNPRGTSVRTFGGVLEHPARSQAWPAFRLPQPRGPHWRTRIDEPGWVCEIDQHLYGFPTRKLTWLYYVGESPPALNGARSLAVRGCETLWSTERSKTPPAFRDLLLAMARSATVPVVAL